jgi:glycosyltransferase involved in cell wall biosynthesis
MPESHLNTKVRPMDHSAADTKSILMIAYTNYRTDPRVIRAAEAASNAGFDVDLIALRRPNDPPEESINGVRVIHLNQARYRGGGTASYVLAYLEFFMRCFFKTASLLLRKRYAAVHVHNMPDFYVFCALIPKLMGAKVLLDIHDPMPNTFASKFKSGENGLFFKLLLCQERLSAAFADQVLTVHEPVKEYVLVKQHKLRAEDIEVVANFPDGELFALQKRPQADGRLRLVFHGTILERCGLRNAMLALAGMRHRDLATVRIIGEGDFSEQLKGLIGDLDLGGVVHFDNRMYPLAEIPGLLADCNLGLVPLEISSITNYVLPLKLLEYLSLGMPSVTVRNAAIGYYFSEDDCLFYDPTDPQSLRAVLDRLAADPELLAHYQERAVALRGKFQWANERQKYVSLLRGLTQHSLEASGKTSDRIRSS